MKVHAPFWSSVLLTGSPPGNTIVLVTCVGLAWLPPGATTHTSCGNVAVSAGKLHSTLSPLLRDTASGAQRSPLASTLTVLGVEPPPPAGSVAENFTLPGPV